MKVILILPILFTLIHGHYNSEFLKTYCRSSDDVSRFPESDIKKCLLCKDVLFTESDAEVFKTGKFNLTHSEYVIFEGGNVGIVNSDFFKHFPNTKHFIFDGTIVDLRPSETLTNNSRIELIYITNSTILRSNETNALHSLRELKEIHMRTCFFENATIDGELLRMNRNLLKILFEDRAFSMEGLNSSIKHIDDDAFDGLDKLDMLFIDLQNINNLSSRWFHKKPLTVFGFDGKLEEFPKDLPETISHLDIPAVKHMTRDDFKSLKNLNLLGFRGEIGTIDLDAFDDLVNLKMVMVDTKAILRTIPRNLLDKLKRRKILVGADTFYYDDGGKINFV